MSRVCYALTESRDSFGHSDTGYFHGRFLMATIIMCGILRRGKEDGVLQDTAYEKALLIVIPHDIACTS